MSQKELDRLHIIKKVCDKEFSQKSASERLNISIRQVKRLVFCFRRLGDSGLISKQRHKRSNHQLKQSLKDEVSRLITEQYRDFGPTLTSEKLKERHDLSVSKETIRQMKISLGLHIPKSRKAKRIFQLRERRPRMGEMVQIDGSHHAWFEDRGKKCCLIVFIDDATSQLLSMFFHPSESLHAYIKAIKSHILSHGCPLSYYSDRHGIFRVNIKEAKTGDGMTQLGKILKDLNIESICALTPQAKGRVERANQTLQDRFIKEMRLEGISTIEEANAFIPKFIALWNKRFGKPPANPENAHRAWEKSEAELDLALAHRDSRVISKSLTFQYEGGKYCIKTIGPGTAMWGGKIDISRLQCKSIIREKRWNIHDMAMLQCLHLSKMKKQSMQESKQSSKETKGDKKVRSWACLPCHSVRATPSLHDRAGKPNSEFVMKGHFYFAGIGDISILL